MISREQLGKAMSYTQYSTLVERLLAEGKTTSQQQHEGYLDYTKVNLQRMRRLDKTIVLGYLLEEALGAINCDYTWIVLTEGWCGDASQCLPLLAAIEKKCDHISLKLLLRDANLELMDQHLTGNSRSIPKLICVKNDSLAQLFTWGPRPAPAQALVAELKAKDVPAAERSLQVQKWYNADKTLTQQSEFLALIKRHMA